MVYIRGHALDFERWQSEIEGGENDREVRWDFGSVLPYFKRAQKSHTKIRNEEVDSYKGFEGPLDVTNGGDLAAAGTLSKVREREERMPDGAKDGWSEATAKASYHPPT
jgi:choline dehydrogenase-like flavoprotein